MTADERITHVFVYGTLLPGDVRFPRMAPFVIDDGWADTVVGRLFDTGNDYPGALLGPDADAPDPVIHGRTFGLLEETRLQAIDLLDEIEGVVGGQYRRVPVTTGTGTRAWIYEYGDGLDLTPIPSGDWLAHRPPELARPLDGR